MRSREIRQRIGQNLKKPSLKKQSDFQDVERSPWYDIQLEWKGQPSLFKMHYEDPSFPVDSAELKHVFAADEDMDEWVESPREALEDAKADMRLMGELHRIVGALERGRGSSQDSSEDDDVV